MTKKGDIIVYLNKRQFAVLYLKKKNVKKFVDSGFVKTCDELVKVKTF